MNEIQIIQQQLATEKLHFSEVAAACAAAIDSGRFTAGSEFATACAEYFAFAVGRFTCKSGAHGTGASTAPLRELTPGADASEACWREFLPAFNDGAARHFTAIDQLQSGNLPVTEWRALSRIDADAIITERARYKRVKASIP